MEKAREPYHKANLEAVLVRTATEMIAERGLDALSLRELGKAAGVSRSAPYHYFPDKSALLAKVGSAGFGMLGAHIAAARPTDDSFEAAVRAGLGAYVDFALSHRDLFRLMFANVLQRDLTATHVGGSDQTFAFSSLNAMTAFGDFVRAIQGAQAAGLLMPGDPLRIVNTLWAFAHGVAELALGDNLKMPYGVDTILTTGIGAIVQHFTPSGVPAPPRTGGATTSAADTR